MSVCDINDCMLGISVHSKYDKCSSLELCISQNVVDKTGVFAVKCIGSDHNPASSLPC